MRRLFRRLGGCERGAAAIEFALIAPVLILLHFGAVEVIQAWEAARRAAHVAAALADLTAQNRTISTAELNDILLAGTVMISPFPAERLGARISSFTADGAGVVKQDWTQSRNWTATGAASVPTGYLQASESAIVVDVTFRHEALFALVLRDGFTIKKRAYLRPRLAAQVTKTS